MREDFFEKIHTPEKAYWLGFLFADGSVSTSRNRIKLHLAIKDEDQIDRFLLALEATDARKSYYGPYENSGKSVQVIITSSQMKQDLMKAGCSPSKTFSIRFPNLSSEELDLAFLMGFFDGDGNEADSTLNCGCLPFLEDVQKKFNTTSTIKKSRSTYRLYLGAVLFRRMMKAYPQSMSRKRKTHKNGYLYDSNMEQPYKTNNHTSRRKFDPSPEELKKLVWEMPATKVGEHFGVSGRAIKKRCRKYEIETPGRGYWAKKKARK